MHVSVFVCLASGFVGISSSCLELYFVTMSKWTLANVVQEVHDCDSLMQNRTAPNPDLMQRMVNSISFKIRALQDVTAAQSVELQTALQASKSLPDTMKEKIQNTMDGMIGTGGQEECTSHANKQQKLLHICNFLTASEWASLRNVELSEIAKRQLVVLRLKKLGVRNLAEKTVRSAVAALCCCLAEQPDNDELFQMVADFKVMFHATETPVTCKNLPFVHVYPEQPAHLPQGILDVAYTQEDPPVAMQFEKFNHLCSCISLRGNSKKLSPKAQASSKQASASSRQASSSSALVPASPSHQPMQMQDGMQPMMAMMQMMQPMVNMMMSKFNQGMSGAGSSGSWVSTDEASAFKPKNKDIQLQMLSPQSSKGPASSSPGPTTVAALPVASAGPDPKQLVFDSPSTAADSPLKEQTAAEAKPSATTEAVKEGMEDKLYTALKDREDRKKKEKDAKDGKKPKGESTSKKPKAESKKPKAAQKPVAKPGAKKNASKKLPKYEPASPTEAQLGARRDTYTDGHYHKARKLAEKSGYEREAELEYGRAARAAAAAKWQRYTSKP